MPKRKSPHAGDADNVEAPPQRRSLRNRSTPQATQNVPTELGKATDEPKAKKIPAKKATAPKEGDDTVSSTRRLSLSSAPFLFPHIIDPNAKIA
jgi:hypothetical protein